MIMIETEKSVRLNTPQTEENFNGRDLIAAITSNLDTSEILSREPINLNYRDPSVGDSALSLAVKMCNFDLVKILAERGANVNNLSRFGIKPILLCGSGDKANIIKVLVKHGADINTRTLDNKVTLLHKTIWREDNIEKIKLLISLGADIDALCGNGQPAIYHAARKRHAQTVKLLVSEGANAEFLEANPFEGFDHMTLINEGKVIYKERVKDAKEEISKILAKFVDINDPINQKKPFLPADTMGDIGGFLDLEDSFSLIPLHKQSDELYKETTTKLKEISDKLTSEETQVPEKFKRKLSEMIENRISPEISPLNANADSFFDLLMEEEGAEETKSDGIGR